MTTTILYRFVVRGGTAAAVAALNEVPKARELIFETDTGKFKLGDGSTAYNSLDYVGEGVWEPLGGGGGGPVGSQIGYAYTQTTTAVSGTGSIPYDNTIPQNTEGVAWAALDTAYTPTASSSLIEVEVHIPQFQLSGNNTLIVALFKDSDANAIAAVSISPPNSSYDNQVHLRYIASAGSTASRTYKVRYGITGGATAYFLQTSGSSAIFGGVMAASVTVREIKQ